MTKIRNIAASEKIQHHSSRWCVWGQYKTKKRKKIFSKTVADSIPLRLRTRLL